MALEISLKHFKASEFRMDGKDVSGNMNSEFLIKLDACRSIVQDTCDQRDLPDIPFKITSSYRSPEKNKKVGGSPASMHLKGRAVDIELSKGWQRAIVIRAALNMGLSVGLMRSGLHLDDREDQVVFDYYPRDGEANSADE